MFEEGEPPKPKPTEKANEKKERVRKEQIVKHLVDQKAEIKKCKYQVHWVIRKMARGTT